MVAQNNFVVLSQIRRALLLGWNLRLVAGFLDVRSERGISSKA